MDKCATVRDQEPELGTNGCGARTTYPSYAANDMH